MGKDRNFRVIIYLLDSDNIYPAKKEDSTFSASYRATDNVTENFCVEQFSAQGTTVGSPSKTTDATDVNGMLDVLESAFIPITQSSSDVKGLDRCMDFELDSK